MPSLEDTLYCIVLSTERELPSPHYSLLDLPGYGHLLANAQDKAETAFFRNQPLEEKAVTLPYEKAQKVMKDFFGTDHRGTRISIYECKEIDQNGLPILAEKATDEREAAMPLPANSFVRSYHNALRNSHH